MIILKVLFSILLGIIFFTVVCLGTIWASYFFYWLWQFVKKTSFVNLLIWVGHIFIIIFFIVIFLFGLFLMGHICAEFINWDWLVILPHGK